MRLSLVCLCVRVWLLWFLHVQPQPPAISTAQTFTPNSLFQIPSAGRTNVIWNPEKNSAAARPHNSRPTCSLARSPDRGQGVRRGRVTACRSNGAQGPKRRQSCRPHCCVISSQGTLPRAGTGHKLYDPQQLLGGCYTLCNGHRWYAANSRITKYNQRENLQE